MDAFSTTRSRRLLRLLVFVALVASAGTAFFLTDPLWRAAREGTLPTWAPLIPSLLFTLFVIIFAIDRWAQVRRQSYPPGRAIFQVAFALVFLTFLWPSQAIEFRRARQPLPEDSPKRDLLTHPNPDVRALACEVAGLKGQVHLRDAIEERMLEDSSQRVREACRDAYQRLREEE